MDQDQIPVAEPAVAEPVQAPEATAAPESATEQPADQQPRTFSQEEVDALITKRLAKEQRKWEKRIAQPQQIDPDNENPSF